MENQIEKTIQFLVCPQNDFIETIKKGSHKNKLHVGYEGALKLRGDPENNEPDFFIETVSRFFNDRIRGSEKAYVIIDEDWHPKTCHEFDTFGIHCIKGSDGAKLPGKLEDFRRHPRCYSIRANSINVASDTRYDKTLREVIGTTKPTNLRAGVIGVWTHVKVEYLLFNLHTLWPKLYFDQMAVCEPLCASPRESFHRAAINKFHLFRINVFTDIDRYCEWMGLNAEDFEQRLERHRD